MIIIPKSDIYFIKHKHTVIRQNKKIRLFFHNSLCS